MLNKKSSVIFLLTLMMIFILTSLCFASRAKGRIPSKKLDLTSEQKEKIRDVRLNLEKERVKLKADLKIAQLGLKDLSQQKNPSPEKIYGKIDQIGDLRTKLQKNRVTKKLGIREVLTDEQWEKFQSLKPRLFLERKFQMKEKKDRLFLRHKRGFWF